MVWSKHLQSKGRMHLHDGPKLQRAGDGLINHGRWNYSNGRIFLHRRRDSGPCPLQSVPPQSPLSINFRQGKTSANDLSFNFTSIDAPLIRQLLEAQRKSQFTTTTTCSKAGIGQRHPTFSGILPEELNNSPEWPYTSPLCHNGVENTVLGRFRYDLISAVPAPPYPRANNFSTGVAVRVWQLGLEMRPFFNRSSLWAYPIFAGVGGSFGYWLQGVDERQSSMLQDRKAAILEKRARRAAREADKISAEHA